MTETTTTAQQQAPSIGVHMVRDGYRQGLSAVAVAGRLAAAGYTPQEIEECIRAADAEDAATAATGTHSETVHDDADGDRRSATSPANGAKGGRPPGPCPADLANAFAGTFKDDDGRPLIRYWRGEWFEYKPVAGWRGLSEAELEGRLITYMRNIVRYRAHAKKAMATSVLLNLRAHDLCGIPEHIDRPVWLDSLLPCRNVMSFSNGLAVDLWRYAEALAAKQPPPEDVIIPASPDLFSSDFVPYPWAPDTFPERFHSYLDRVQPDPENVHALRRMLGLLLVDCARYEVFWQFFGTGRNGKTVMLDIVKGLLGAHNVSFVPLNGLIERFQPWPLAYSKANICGELPTDIGRGQYHQIEGAFKDAVSGGDIEIEKKGADKFAGRCRARFVISANSLPTFVDRSDGIWRRLRVIPFPVQIPDEEKDVNLAAKICRAELPGVLRWALDGLAEVISRGDAPDCPAGLLAKNAHRSNCDHERQFLEENYVKGGPDDRQKAAEMYDAYREWMFSNGYKPMGAGKFYSRVEDAFPPTRQHTLRIGNETVRGFDGITKRAPNVGFPTIVTTSQLAPCET